MDSTLIQMRIKATGQVLDLVPHVARAMYHGGTAELINESDRDRMTIVAPAETAAIEPRAETAVTKAHKPPKKKARSAK